MRTGFRAALGAAAIVLGLPGASLAATTTVDPAAGGACAAGGTCATIQAAVNASAAGDTVAVHAGTYTEDVTVGKANLDIAADKGAQLAGSITATGAGFHLENLLLVRATGSGAALTASGGGLQVTGAAIASAAGPGVSITGGDNNVIARSSVASANPASDAISQSTSATGNHGLFISSSVIIGGTDAAGLRVVTSGQSGPATLVLRHLTMPLVAKNAIVLDSTAATGTPGLGSNPTGNITATISASILHSKEGSVASNFIPTLLNLPLPVSLQSANSITVTQTTSDANVFTAVPAQGAGPQIDQGNPTLTSDFQLFDSTYHLIVGSPAIDAGGAVAQDEAAQDVDGDPRSDGAASDIGADEFVDHAPVANKVTVSPASPKSGQEATITIDATDPDSGDVLGYGFNFGDQSNDKGTTKSVTHTWNRPGTYQVDGIVVDRANKFSAITSTQVTVVDGNPPDLNIGSYKLSGFRKGLSISGGVADGSGIGSVEVAVTRLAGCRQFNGSKFVKHGGCKGYIFRPATVAGQVWNLVLPSRLKLPKGKYQIRARATDSAGNTTSGFKAARKTLVSFAVK